MLRQAVVEDRRIFDKGSNKNSWWYSVWQRSWFMYDWEEAPRHGNLWMGGGGGSQLSA
jgi:hypothetical protein